MPDLQIWIAFVIAAEALLILPGPTDMVVVSYALTQGKRSAWASVPGVTLGDATALILSLLGLGAILMASAELFNILKIAGALYLVYLGIKTWREAGAAPEFGNGPAMGMRKAFKEGVIVEALNPKTAAFFLAFLPQFVVPAEGHVWLQFIVLGTISVFLNTAVDVVVTYAASAVRDRLAARPAIIRRMRQTSGGILCALGVTLVLAKRPA